MSNKRAYNPIPNLSNGTKSRSGTRKVHPKKQSSTNKSGSKRHGTRKIAFNNHKLSAEPQSLVESLLEMIRIDEAKLAEKYDELEKARKERYLEMKKSSNLSRAQLNTDSLGDY